MNYRKLAVFGILGVLLVVACLVLLHNRRQEQWGRQRMGEVEKQYQQQIVQITEIFRKGPPAKGDRVSDAPELAALAAPGLLGAYLSYDGEKIVRYHWFELTEADGFRGRIVLADGDAALGRGTVKTSQRG